MPDYAIKTNERLTLIGKTGSGKTYLARLLTLGIPRLVVFDPKGTFGDPKVMAAWRLENWSDTGARKLAEGKAVRLRVPPADFGGDIFGHWIPYMEAIYRAGDCTLYIDEIYGVNKPGSMPSPELAALYTRGRELGIGVFGASQRPTLIPLFLLSEVEWLFCFRLLLEADQQRMMQLMKIPPSGDQLDPLPIPDEYGYWFFNTSWRAPVYSRGV